MVSNSKAMLPLVFLLLGAVANSNGGVPYAKTNELGLYNASDKVFVLTEKNFKATVVQQNHSSLVEFYNSYCGHCKRFAPSYKELASQLYSWRDVLRVTALDCAAEENNGICREYEVMAYPTLRYIGPGYVPRPHDYGRLIDTQDLDEIRTNLAQWVAAENRTANMTTWPNLQSLKETEMTHLFEGLDSRRQYVVMVYEPENTTLGVETALFLLRWPSVVVRRITDPELALKYQIDGINYHIATVDRKNSVVPYSPLGGSARSYADTIESVLRAQHFTEKPDVATSTANPVVGDNTAELNQKEALLKEVQRNKHLVYQADLEMAIRGIIFNEIPKSFAISGERLLALQRVIHVLNRYNPLGSNGRVFMQKLYEFVMSHSQQLDGKEFEEEVARLEKQSTPIFSSSQYVGCMGSRPGLRGYTCSLWTLFHFLTVQAARSETSQDPLEVLQCIHGYVKNFFGCTDCSEHFQAMASHGKIWNTSSKDEAVLWLWMAHNEVNMRLAGDSTEDPLFPKIQFPSRSSCSQCYKQSVMSPATSEFTWDNVSVLSFLKNIYNPEFISRLGVDNDEKLSPTADKLRQKRMISNVFSDMDMRMGMLLYGFCIVMMVLAFKLFVFKGYRKKPYGHDMLGKV